MLLEMFAVYTLTAQGMRYISCVVSAIYTIMDFSLGNWFSSGMSFINVITALLAIVKNRGEGLVDREELREHLELIRFTTDIRPLRRTKARENDYQE